MTTATGGDIQATTGFTISPSNTIRWKAFGAASDVLPNPIDGTIAASNTEIISINDNILGMMSSGDVRNNYYMTGATWTIGGFPPVPVFGFPTPSNLGNQVGTSQLANTTMETYQQGVDPTSNNGGSNCFLCHSGERNSHRHHNVEPCLRRDQTALRTYRRDGALSVEGKRIKSPSAAAP